MKGNRNARRERGIPKHAWGPTHWRSQVRPGWPGFALLVGLLAFPFARDGQTQELTPPALVKNQIEALRENTRAIESLGLAVKELTGVLRTLPSAASAPAAPAATAATAAPAAPVATAALAAPAATAAPSAPSAAYAASAPFRAIRAACTL